MSGAETKIAPEVIEAGCRVLLESGALPNDYLSSADPILVRDIYLAMRRAEGVTPEMIDAGLEHLYATGRWEHRSREWDRELIAGILSDALALSPVGA